MLSLAGLHIRAAFFRSIREFFTTRGFLEVDTPIRQPVIIPECNIVSVSAEGQFLQTSPELCMKRLLAAGCQKIFQICPCFRKNELGRYHLEEFTMLEWYRAGDNYRQLMLDCEELLQYVVEQLAGELLPPAAEGCTDQSVLRRLGGPAEYLTVAEAFDRFAPVTLEQAMAQGCFDEVLVEHVEPHLGSNGPLFLLDYPRELASLAKVDPARPAVAERFELYCQGIELANGFSELTDAKEQRRRFVIELNMIRSQQGREQQMPERFLDELPQVAEAAGIAFGLDRLLMLVCGKSNISEVVTFNPGDF